MRRILLRDNASNTPRPMLLCGIRLRSHSLGAAAVDPWGVSGEKMKRPAVRQLFGVLLLVALAAALGFRAVGRVGPEYAPVPVFNATLLEYAAVELGEEKMKREIEQLLDGSFLARGRYRAFPALKEADRVRLARGALGMMLRPLELHQSWTEFRRVLQDWKRKRRFQPEVMLDLVRLVKRPIDGHNGLALRSDHRYSSCAVVGNSGILLRSDHGEMIDSHDVVIRLNNARVESYERKVGFKTNISFVNSNILHLCARREGCFCHPYGPRVPIVMYVCQPAHLFDYAVCNASHKAPLLVTDPRFDVLCSRIVKYYSLKRFAAETGKSLDEWGAAHEGPLFHYSSGMQAVMLALGICERVSMFGFGKLPSAKHHYHSNQKAELALHDYEAEYEFYYDLIHRPQVIPFLSDKFKIHPVTMYQ